MPLSGPGKSSPSTSPHVPEQGLPDRGRTPATLQPDFEQGTYTGTYHALMKSSGMCPSDWRNDLTHNQFMGSSMLLSWDLTPNASNGMAYLYSRHLGTVKASRIFAKPLPTTTPLIAYAQYDNLVFINYNCTVTFDYNTLCMADSFRRPWSQSCQGSGRRIHQGWMLAPPAQFPAGYLINMACSGSGNTGWQPSSRTQSTPSILILMGLHRLSHIPMLVGGGLSGLTLQHKNATGPIHTVLPSTSWPCTARACHWRLWPVNSRNTNSPAMVPWTNVSWDRIYTLTRALDCHLAIKCL